jgi:hypothetical protein
MGALPRHEYRRGGHAANELGIEGHPITKVEVIAFREARRGRVIFDKDQGLEIPVRARGGVYPPLNPGEPTGFDRFDVTHFSLA